MYMPDSRTLKSKAAPLLARADQANQIALIYSLIAIGVAAVITVLQYVLAGKIDQTGGLHNMGIRSVFSTISNFLPVLQMVILMCLDFGFLAAMVRISRGLYTSPNTLRAGMDRFWPLARCTVIKNIVYTGTAMICGYVAILIFFLSPFSDATVELLAPIVSESSILNSGNISLDSIDQAALYRSLIPVFAIWLLTLLAFFVPTFYRYRLANYVLYDHPEKGALYAMRESRNLMRGNLLTLLKLDFSFWWYYLGLLLASFIGYLDMVLSMLGITLPLPETVLYFGFYFLALAVQLLIFLKLKTRVELTYAVAYNSVRPEEPKQGGVVLGNIFQM